MVSHHLLALYPRDQAKVCFGEFLRATPSLPSCLGLGACRCWQGCARAGFTPGPLGVRQPARLVGWGWGLCMCVSVFQCVLCTPCCLYMGLSQALHFAYVCVCVCELNPCVFACLHACLFTLDQVRMCSCLRVFACPLLFITCMCWCVYICWMEHVPVGTCSMRHKCACVLTDLVACAHGAFICVFVSVDMAVLTVSQASSALGLPGGRGQVGAIPSG